MAVYRITRNGRSLVRAALLILIPTLTLVLTYLSLFSSPHYKQIPNYAPLRTTTPASHVAIATFLSGTQDSSEPIDDDFYFKATRTLAYQILHDPKTRSQRADIPFLVLCTRDVALSKIDRLRLDGATVTVVDDVPLPWWVSTGVTRWKDQFTKLRIFEMTDFERVLFIDADTMLTNTIDGIFDELSIQIPMTTQFHRTSELKHDEKPLPSNYIFAARSDNAFSGERDHPFPPPPTERFSAGFWVAAPSKEMFEYLTSVMSHWRRFNPHTMEQSLLNYAFRREGPMPWFELGWEWSATWPSLKDRKGGVRSLHEKWAWEGPKEIRDEWEEMSKKMESFQKESTGWIVKSEA